MVSWVTFLLFMVNFKLILGKKQEIYYFRVCFYYRLAFHFKSVHLATNTLHLMCPVRLVQPRLSSLPFPQN